MLHDLVETGQNLRVRADQYAAVQTGLGRIVALYQRSSISYQIR
jgi:hypothetical protein